MHYDLQYDLYTDIHYDLHCAFHNDLHPYLRHILLHAIHHDLRHDLDHDGIYRQDHHRHYDEAAHPFLSFVRTLPSKKRYWRHRGGSLPRSPGLQCWRLIVPVIAHLDLTKSLFNIVFGGEGGRAEVVGITLSACATQYLFLDGGVRHVEVRVFAILWS